MGLFSFFKRNTKAAQPLGRPPIAAEYLDKAPASLKIAEAKQHFEMLMESIELLSQTVYCKTFFYRYEFALEKAQQVLQLSKGLNNEAAAQEMYDILVREKTTIVNGFLFRCYDAGKLQYVKQDIVPYMDDVPEESLELLQMMLEYKQLSEESAQRRSQTALFTLLLGAQLLTGVASPANKSHNCNGNCASCPAHYGCRYGRWYYGHGHQGNCERHGNGGIFGRTYRD